MPLVQTKGAASAQGFGEFAQQTAANYIEDVFNTWVYTLDVANTDYTIQNNIDLSTKGGLVWFKPRSQPSSGNGQNFLFDTARGSSTANQRRLITNDTSAQTSGAGDSIQFNANGFTALYLDGGSNLFRTTNNFGQPYKQCAWTFRKQPKFFDVVTYTGDGTSNRSISHNLGSTPGMITAKATSTTGDWMVWHRSIGANGLILNLTDAQGAYFSTQYMQNSTSTIFKVNSDLNTNGVTYVAYLFAHDAGGFGTAGTDNVISCGSYVGNGLTAGPNVNLGFEPQWVLRKNITAARGGPGTAGSWSLVDTMRGMSQTTCPFLFANESAAEDTSTVTTGYIIPNATGFVDTYTYPGDTYIYMAIRRPMKVPTDATTVFVPRSQTGGGTVTTNFVVDSSMSNVRVGNGAYFFDRLRGTSTTNAWRLTPTSTGAEANVASGMGFDNNTGYVDAYYAGDTIVYWNFSRRPGFFDTVCYTGNGSTQNITHNLGVAPEFMIIKVRNTIDQWITYSLPTGNQNYGLVNSTVAWVSGGAFTWNNTTPTSSVFSLGSAGSLNGSGNSYVAYLFATCPGVSKVGSYTGTGATQTINCGFTGGARFVLIKRTDSTGGWYVWDTARGMVSGTDPSLQLNSTAAEVNADSVYTVSTGFQIVSTAADINASGGSYVFLAIA
jgi:hypothetical protein